MTDTPRPTALASAPTPQSLQFPGTQGVKWRQEKRWRLTEQSVRDTTADKRGQKAPAGGQTESLQQFGGWGAGMTETTATENRTQQMTLVLDEPIRSL